MYYRFFSKIYEIGAKRMCEECEDFIEKRSKILDLGCGSGIAAKYFQSFFQSDIMGVDIKDNRLVDIPFQVIDGENLPFSENSFDIVLINYVLHHTQNPEKLLAEAKRVGERIILFEDLPEGILSKLRCRLHEITFFGGKRERRKKLNFKTKKEWESLFKKLGLKIVAQKRALKDFRWLDPVKRIIFVLEKIQGV